MDNKTLGYTYVLISQIFFIFWPIASTLGFGYYNLMTTMVIWFGSASISSFLIILLLRKTGEYKLLKKYWKPVLGSSLFDVVSIVLSFYTLRMIGPSLNSFLGKIGILTTIFFGVVFLKERFNKPEIISTFIIIFGVFVISFSTGDNILLGISLLLIGSVFYSTSKYIIKSRLEEISPLFLAHYRVVIVFLFLFSFALASGQFNFYPSKGMIFLSLSIFPAIFGHTLIYKAYKLMEISKIELINALQPFLVVIVSYVVFNEMLSLQQLIGGILIVIGIVFLIYSKNNIAINGQLVGLKNRLINNKAARK